MNEPVFASGHIKSYVLRTGHFTDSQKRSYNLLAEKYLIPFQDSPENPCIFFKNNNPVFLEIGFGMGTATAEIAAENPGKNYLGIEVHKPGIGRLLGLIEKYSLSNIRIIEYDASLVVTKMLAAT